MEYRRLHCIDLFQLQSVVVVAAGVVVIEFVLDTVKKYVYCFLQNFTASLRHFFYYTKKGYLNQRKEKVTVINFCWFNLTSFSFLLWLACALKISLVNVMFTIKWFKKKLKITAVTFCFHKFRYLAHFCKRKSAESMIFQ